MLIALVSSEDRDFSQRSVGKNVEHPCWSVTLTDQVALSKLPLTEVGVGCNVNSADTELTNSTDRSATSLIG